MIAGRASSTAQRVARSRAAHQLLDRPPVFTDPLAVQILGPLAAAVLQANPRRAEIGFTAVEDLGESEINNRYFSKRTDGLRVGSLGRLVRARV